MSTIYDILQIPRESVQARKPVKWVTRPGWAHISVTKKIIGFWALLPYVYYCYGAGLSVTEAGKLSSYLHFREKQQHSKKSIKEKADLDPSIDFLDCIESDIPRGENA